MGQLYIRLVYEGILLDKPCPYCQCISGWPRSTREGRCSSTATDRRGEYYRKYLWACAKCWHRMYRIQHDGLPIRESGYISKEKWPLPDRPDSRFGSVIRIVDLHVLAKSLGYGSMRDREDAVRKFYRILRGGRG